jgi:hypothetical protein
VVVNAGAATDRVLTPADQGLMVAPEQMTICSSRDPVIGQQPVKPVSNRVRPDRDSVILRTVPQHTESPISSCFCRVGRFHRV